MDEPEVRYLQGEHSYLQFSIAPGEPYPVCFTAADRGETPVVLVRCTDIDDVRLTLLDILDLVDEAIQYRGGDNE